MGSGGFGSSSGGCGNPSSQGFIYSHLAATLHGDKIAYAALRESSSVQTVELRLMDQESDELVSQVGDVDEGPIALGSDGEKLLMLPAGPIRFLEHGLDERMYLAGIGPGTVAFTGKVWVLVSGANMAILDFDGTEMAPGVTPIVTASTNPLYETRVIQTALGALLTWRQEGEVYASRLGNDGIRIDESPIHLAHWGVPLASASIGKHALVLLARDVEGGGRELEAVRIDLATGELARTKLVDETDFPLVEQRDMTLTAGDGGYLLSWRMIDGIKARHLDLEGNWNGSSDLIIEGWNAASIAPAAVHDGGGFLVLAANLGDYETIYMGYSRVD